MAEVPSLEVIGWATGPFAENTYVAIDRTSRRAAIVDPGEAALGTIRQLQDSHDFEVERILLTHAHLDHIFGLSEVWKAYRAPIHLHPADRYWIDNYVEAARAWGFEVEPAPSPDREYRHGDEVSVGNVKVSVRHTPGHSPGGVILTWPGPGVGEPGGAFSGDTIMGFSIGRTDFPGGDIEALKRSITEQVYTLGDDTILYPGHMQPTTVGEEKRRNSFVRG